MVDLRQADVPIGIFQSFNVPSCEDAKTIVPRSTLADGKDCRRTEVETGPEILRIPGRSPIASRALGRHPDQ